MIRNDKSECTPHSAGNVSREPRIAEFLWNQARYKLGEFYPEIGSDFS